MRTSQHSNKSFQFQSESPIQNTTRDYDTKEDGKKWSTNMTTYVYIM
jgi:hypothetical protein